MRDRHNDRIQPNRRSFILGGSLAAMSGLAGLPGMTAGHRGGGNRCDVVVDGTGGGDASTIQDGVDLAAPDDRVCIATGTYSEHVHVDKDLTLTNVQGASPTIEIPSDPPNYETPESGNTFEPIVFIGQGTGASSVEVDVSGIEIDGKDQQPNAGANVVVGLLVRNTRGSIEDISIVNMAVGGSQTGGISVYGNSNVNIHGNSVDQYERFGIVANGDGGVHPSPTANIRDNDVIGSGDGSKTSWGPNGIQIGFGAEGSIRNNTVHQNRWSDTAQVASGIIVFESDGVMVSGNTVTESDAALTCGTWGWFRQTATNNKFDRNEVDGAIIGVHLEAVAFDGFTTTDPTLNDTKIVNNELEQGGTGADPASDSIGVELLAADADPSYDPEIGNTKIIRNRMDGFATEVDDGGTDTKKHANVVPP